MFGHFFHISANDGREATIIGQSAGPRERQRNAWKFPTAILQFLEFVGRTMIVVVAVVSPRHTTGHRRLRVEWSCELCAMWAQIQCQKNLKSLISSSRTACVGCYITYTRDENEKLRFFSSSLGLFAYYLHNTVRSRPACDHTKLPLDSNMCRDRRRWKVSLWINEEKTHHKKTMMIIVGILRVSNPAPKTKSLIHTWNSKESKMRERERSDEKSIE